MHLKISSAKWRPFSLGLNVLTVLPISSEKQLRSLASELQGIQPTKQDMQLDLVELEMAAEMALDQDEEDSDSTDSDDLESEDDLVAKVADLKVKDEVLVVGKQEAGAMSALRKGSEEGVVDLREQLAGVRLAAGGPGEGGEQKGQPSKDGQEQEQTGGGDQNSANGANGARAKKQSSKDPSGQGRKDETSDSSDSDSYTDSDTCSEDEYDIELMEKVTGSVQ